MPGPGMLLDASDSALLLVDIQEKFRPAIAGMENVIARAQVLARAAGRLGIPAFATEQYPKALGPTVSEIRRCLPDDQAYVAKMCFSAVGSEPLRAALDASKRNQVVLAGVETHVCVLQTGLELLQAGRRVFVVSDAVSSRNDADRDAALHRLERGGAEIVTTEMAVFEWLRKAGTPEFKELQALIK